MERSISAALILALIMVNPVQAGTCTPTPQMSAGNNFEPVMRHEVDVGMGLLIEGRILDTDCQPIPGARIAHWQAVATGFTKKVYALICTATNKAPIALIRSGP